MLRLLTSTHGHSLNSQSEDVPYDVPSKNIKVWNKTYILPLLTYVSQSSLQTFFLGCGAAGDRTETVSNSQGLVLRLYVSHWEETPRFSLVTLSAR